MNKKESALPWNTTATRFWWVRHAPVTHLSDIMYGTQDVDGDVSDTARFTELATRLPQNAIWYTSDLKRTHQTADAVAAQGLKSAGRIENKLIREMDFGTSTGKTHQQLLGERNDPYRGFWPMSPVDEVASGESMRQMCDRVESFKSAVIADHQGLDVICFSHMGPILAALTIALSLDLHNSVSFSIDNLSITRIHHFAGLDEKAPEYRVMRVSEM